MRLYTTISHGETYIAADALYVGKVNSYNNFFTRFLSRLLNISMEVDFEGKRRVVNKRSYLNLIQKLGHRDAKISNLSQYRLFRPIADRMIPQEYKMMREAIDKETSLKLFRKLAHAIWMDDTGRALKMIGKGAAVEAQYLQTVHGPKFTHHKAGLSSNKSYDIQFFQGTPILMAARQVKFSRGSQVVVNTLHHFGADAAGCQGTTFRFKRQLVRVESQRTFGLNPCWYYRDGFLPRPGINPGFRRRTVLMFDDSERVEKTFKLDNHLRLVEM